MAASNSVGVIPQLPCPICLYEITECSYTDTCFHEFCFGCLLEWSKINNQCPVCKEKFSSILQSIEGIGAFKQHKILLPTEENGARELPASARPSVPSRRNRQASTVAEQMPSPIPGTSTWNAGVQGTSHLGAAGMDVIVVEDQAVSEPHPGPSGMCPFDRYRRPPRSRPPPIRTRNFSNESSVDCITIE